jgi:hypothetical protein
MGCPLDGLKIFHEIPRLEESSEADNISNVDNTSAFTSQAEHFAELDSNEAFEPEALSANEIFVELQVDVNLIVR